MRTKLKICVEARYLVLSRGYREQDGVVVDPFDEMKRTTMMVRSLVAIGIVAMSDVDDLVADCSRVGGAWVLADGVSDRFGRAVRERFFAWADSPQERSIFETVVPSICQLCLEDGLALSVHGMHADREVFQRHRRGGHPRYVALAGRLLTQYQRTFFAMYGDKALDYVNVEIAGWKRAVRWFREGGVERDRQMPLAPVYADGRDSDDGSDDGEDADQ